MLTITRPIIFLDTETTGPAAETDRIVEIGFTILKPGAEPVEWWSLIRPGIPIPREASHGNGTTYPGHGIDDAAVAGCRVCYRADESVVSITEHLDIERGHPFEAWPSFAEIAKKLAAGFSDCDFAGYNLERFDLPLIAKEMERAATVWSYDDAHILDAQRLWQLIETRTLSDAVEHFLGRKHEGAHRTTTDVKASLEVIQAQAERLGLSDVGALHDLQWPQEPHWLDPKGKLIWNEQNRVVVNFGKRWKGQLLTMMTRKDLLWIADEATGISPKVRQICREAAAGRFPERTT